MKVGKLKELLQGIPDDVQVKVVSGHLSGTVTGIWIGDSLELVVPTMRFDQPDSSS